MTEPIRDIVYQRIADLTEAVIQEGFVRNNGPKIIDDIVSGCIGRVRRLPGDTDENIGIMATVIMHYLLTCLLIPSHRKVEVDDIPIDVVIPDIKTLGTSWNSCIILCILDCIDKECIERKISDAAKVQPNHDNIWIIAPRHIDVGYRTFAIGSMKCPFSGIITQINEFLDGNKSSRFRIFKAV